ncbi:MAG: glycosyltransferase [Deltaproteobacteria bacterium]|nr:glycosyltransferase [Deltaproteobacteria bacterium]
MRVALLTSYRQQCGVATYAENLVEALPGAGVEPVVFAPRLARGERAAAGPSPPRLWGANRAFGVEAVRVMRAIRAARCDLVHLNVNLSLFSSRIVFALGGLARLAGLPVVATLHGRDGGGPGRRFKVWRLQRALRGARLVVHNDEHARELVDFGHPVARVAVIPHGMPPAAPARSLAEARRALGLAPERRVLAHFGFLVPDKGVLEVLRAFASLRRQGAHDLHYWVSGAVNPRDEASRAYFEVLREEVTRLGVADHVHLTGEFVSHEAATAAMQAADWVVLNYLTGSSQASSGAVSRALASGRPVAVSAAPVFDDVRSAVHTFDGPLEGALASLLEPSGLAESVRERARLHLDRASWPSVAAAHARLYRSLVGSG